ncbi:copper resistance protein CopC [Ornithinimicrobium sp. LYQ92]|uniref:copper resistance CopC family protein n=1 Tax=Serinicoccus sp. LYQ92 TaxID=3378798 RepID=UPI003853FA87
MTAAIRPSGPSRPHVVRRRARASALVLALVLAVLGAAPAQAHDVLVSSSPADGEVLAVPPPEIELTFSGEIQDISPQVIIAGADGTQIASPEPVVDGTLVTADVEDDLPDGSYVVTWRVVSADGHPIAGRFSFGVGDDEQSTPAGATTGDEAEDPTSGSTTTDHGGDHEVLGGHGEHIAMGAGAVALALLGIGGVVLRRRRA